ncbi:MAG: ribonuclease R [Bernardetiaceae bacterium]
MPRKKRKSDAGKKPKKSNRTQRELLQLLQQNPTESFTFRQLCKQLNIQEKESRDSFRLLLDELIESQTIVLQSRGRYAAKEQAGKFMEGRVDYVNREFAYLSVDGLEDDIRISHRRLKQALHDDRVKVKVFQNRKRWEAEVVEILERSRTEFVGRLQKSSRSEYGFVVLDGRKSHFDFFVAPQHLKDARDGDKVIVKLLEWLPDQSSPNGEIIHVLGAAGENETEIHAIMAEYGLPFDFDEKLIEKAAQIPDGVTQEEIAKRRDMRHITTFTIDPDTAKDFDDALSVRPLENGLWEIGVHIADVTHYVRPRTLLEKEATKRATSVYLVDRVVPMLPERLSNELCSLRPREQKLTFSVVFQMDEEGNIHDQWLGRTVICSDRRFTYEDAQVRIETGVGDLAKEVQLLNRIAKKLQEKRFKYGSISFETPEIKFELDEKGRPIGVRPKLRKDSHKLVEDFMLLANRTVGEFAYKYKDGKERNTMVYRVHEPPDPEKIEQLKQFAKWFGYTLDTNPDKLADSLNRLTHESEGKPEFRFLQQLAVRTMSKARYDINNVGHFGLSFDYYTHFTSPIRRYPDMMAHRLLQHYLDGGAPPDKLRYSELCKHSSEQERRATDAERASIKYKQAEYMQQFLEEEFDGLITGVTEWGVYVEILENGCEGLVRLANIEGDYFEYERKNEAVVGQKTGIAYRLGDNVRIEVTGVDLEKRNIDFAMRGDSSKSYGLV